VAKVVAEISRRLVPTPPAPGTAVPFSRHQVDTLREALTALQAGRIGDLTAKLAALLAAN
jgi:hypothetical protein